MNLTVEPLYLISIIVNLTVGIFVIYLFRGQDDRSARYWFLGAFTLSLGVALILFRSYLPAVLSYSAAHFLSTSSSILFGFSLILIGNRKAKFPAISLLICLGYSALLFYLVQSGRSDAVPMIIAGAWSISLVVAGLMSFMANKELKNTYIDLMTWLFAVSAILWLIRIPPLVAGFTVNLADPGLINSVTLVAIIVLGILREMVYMGIRLSEAFKGSLRSEIIKTGETEEALLTSLIALASKRDNETGNHIVRTANYVKIIALRLRAMGHYVDFLTDSRIQDFYRAAPLHDIGKVGIPDSILKNPGSLNADEREIMKTHASIGESILLTVKEKFSHSPGFLDHAIEISGGHHERWDGKGYPRGLRGSDIPLAARIMTVADVYDALVSRRIYKEPWAHFDACEEIAKLSGTKFEPIIVEALMQEKEALDRIQATYQDGLM
ncbi:HD domain-containing phosphohydrolase [Polynucleobacter sp. MWH-UH23A]|uniref:HD-GYP domain-containing protein n=1 Tax=Polynucleobacter sp. MWH-UH23A TaxID=1855613 RepID=UPI003364FB5E